MNEEEVYRELVGTLNEREGIGVTSVMDIYHIFQKEFDRTKGRDE